MNGFVVLFVVSAVLICAEAGYEHGGFHGGFEGGYDGGSEVGYGGEHDGGDSGLGGYGGDEEAHGGGDGGHESEHKDYYAHPKYNFNYAVHDPHTGDEKAHHEERDGDSVKGSYTLKEADGTTRIVEYKADKHSGFNAVVHKIGTPTHGGGGYGSEGHGHEGGGGHY